MKCNTVLFTTLLNTLNSIIMTYYKILLNMVPFNNIFNFIRKYYYIFSTKIKFFKQFFKIYIHYFNYDTSTIYYYS